MRGQILRFGCENLRRLRQELFLYLAVGKLSRAQGVEGYHNQCGGGAEQRVPSHRPQPLSSIGARIHPLLESPVSFFTHGCRLL